MSVRLQYTIPGWEPAPMLPTGAPGTEHLGPSPWSYGTTVQTLPPSWKELLRLDRAQPDELVLDPPPTPPTISYADADEDRKLWTNMLQRHLGSEPASTSEARLLAALDWMHSQDEELYARLLLEGGAS